MSKSKTNIGIIKLIYEKVKISFIEDVAGSKHREKNSARIQLNYTGQSKVLALIFSEYSIVTLNPYWQITETKSENREFTHRVSRKQNPEKFLKF